MTDPSYRAYVARGWHLCAIPRGCKGPSTPGWQRREAAITDPDVAGALQGAGLCHAWSGTCAIDIDDLPGAVAWWRAHGVDLAAALKHPDAVLILSGRAGRAKLIYSLDTPLPTRRITADGSTLCELRCATAEGLTVQDVLPPSIHPDTGRPYRWAGGGDWRSPPPLPAEMRRVWDSLLSQPEVPAQAAPSMEYPEIQQALADLDPDMPYDQWLRVGMAIHYETDGHGLGMWDAWSRGGSKYRGIDDLQTHWTSFRRTDGALVTGEYLRSFSVAAVDEFDDLSTTDPEPEPSSSPSPWTFVRADQWVRQPRPGWLIKQLLPETGLGVIYGRPSTGKTFLMLDLAFAVATGSPWRERKVRQGAVLYMAGEDAGGVRLRIEAWRVAVGDMYGDEVPLYGCGRTPNVMDDREYVEAGNAIVRQARELGARMLVIDTLARTMGGGNENAAEDMGKLIRWAEEVARNAGVLVMLVHHEGKSSPGMRGWSGLHGAIDVGLRVHEEPTGRYLTIDKLKAGPMGGAYRFGLRAVEVARDEDDDPITSCVVEALDDVAADAESPRLGQVQGLVYDTALGMADEDGYTWTMDGLITAAAERLVHDPAKRDTRRQRCVRAIEALVEMGYLERDGEQLRVPRQGD